MADTDIDPSWLAKQFFERVVVKHAYKKSITIGSKTIKREKIFANLSKMGKVIKELGAASILLMEGEELSTFEEAFNEVFYEIAWSRQQRTDRNAASSKGSIYGDHMNYLIYKPAIDVETGVEVLIDPETHRISRTSIEVWKKALPKEVRQAEMAQVINARLEYDPFMLEPVSRITWERAGEVTKINRYIPPAWRKKVLTDEEIDALECPPLMAKFFEHLIPNEECRRYVFFWMRSAIVSRNECYLVLNGAKGIGKNIFTGSVMANLVGREHYIEASRGFLDSPFNSSLKDRRIMVIDEQSVNNAERINKLKSYINQYQNLEAKFENANSMIKLFTSFIITNNASADMHLECDDRRFSVIEVTDKNLNKSFTPDEIDELRDLIENDEAYQAQFGNWLIYHCEFREYSENESWKGKKFYELVYQSLPEWARFIIELLDENPGRTYTLMDLRIEFINNQGHKNVKFPGKQKIEDFLKNYWRDGASIGYWLYDGNGKWAIRSTFDKEEDFDEDEEDGII